MLTKRQFMSKLEKARELELKKQKLQAEILQDYPLKDIPFEAINSENLQDALLCYMEYGETPMSDNVEDFWEAYRKAVKKIESKGE